MKKINYLTSNTFKFTIAKNFFSSVDDYELIQHTFDTPEIQDEACNAIAEYAAVYAAQKLGEPCIKLDAGFYINALNGFPGPFVKYVNDWLSEEDLLVMLENKDDRSAYFMDATAIGFPDGSSKVFSKRHNGRIAHSGEYKASKWPANSLFIPEGYDIPLGSMSDTEQEKYWGDGAWNEVIEYLDGRQF